MSASIDVSCRPAGEGWSCLVSVGDGGGSTQHEVSVSRGELERFASDASEPTELVRRSFDFLLEREPKEAILRRFELSAIERYFPEYEAVIRR